MNMRSSKIESVYWFGRHLYRMHYLSHQVPFQQNDKALNFSRAFCLPAFDASSLNDLLYDHKQPFSFYKQFQVIKRDLVDIKGLLSQQTFQQLSELANQATENTVKISQLINESKIILEKESHEILLFYRLGKHIERLDIQLKLGMSVSNSVTSIAPMIQLLHARGGWGSLSEAWLKFKKFSDMNHFYHFNDQMQCAFEVNHS
ncbi:hypothetical protein [Acinetobacter stercoris]|uniref:DUF403 domain-containing protein n=1 Tax=Acinetobacter stercoris TaxID=2126983 RepID=A0A2U3MXT9_9GAMM|nr:MULTISPECIES: hypothetical protein [Acinetobacter]SPL70119.1 hypothetical protein KPC_1297 [Acinetobacter stercoris]